MSKAENSNDVRGFKSAVNVTPQDIYKDNRIFELPKKTFAPRVCPALALEIGFNESLLLLQLEFSIVVSRHKEDGERWTYQSVTDLQKMFPFWGKATINRAIKSLVAKRLLRIGNFNKRKYDRTRWFAINLDEARKLKSIRVKGDLRVDQNAGTTPQDETCSTQNEAESVQDGITIPKTTTDTTTEKTTEISYDSQSMPSASLEDICERNDSLDEGVHGTPSLSPEPQESLANQEAAAGLQSRSRPLLTDGGNGPVQRIFDFHLKARGWKRAKLTEKIKTAVASRISSNKAVNPNGYGEEEIKFAILGCLASTDKRDAFIYCPEKAEGAFEYDEFSESYHFRDERKDYGNEDNFGFRWKSDLYHICKNPDQIDRFLGIAEVQGFGPSHIRRVEESQEPQN